VAFQLTEALVHELGFGWCFRAIYVSTMSVTHRQRTKGYCDCKLFFSVIDRNVFEMTEKNSVITVRMSENIG